MEPILDGVLEVTGVAAALVIDGNGALVAHRGRSVYDRALCEQLAGKIAKVADALQLQQEDWDAVTAQFSDGKLLLRNLSAGGGSYLLAIVADATLTASFATVAIRVAANKLKKVLAGGTADSSVVAASGPHASVATSAARPAASAVAPPPLPPAADASALSGSGVSWSKSGSSVSLSRVQVADPASGAFLARCGKELARRLGPMARVLVEEAVRRVAGEQPFTMGHAPKLLEDLSGQIEDPDERGLFRKAVQKA